MAEEPQANGAGGEKRFLGLKLHHWIFVGMGLGLLAGGVLNYLSQYDIDAHAPGEQTHMDAAQLKSILWWFDLLGKDVFIGSLKMIIAPLIFASIVSGITSLPNMRELGSIGWKTLIYYMSTTALAVTIGLVAVLLIRPGKKESSQTLKDDRVKELAAIRAEFEAAHPGVDPESAAGRPQFLALIAEKGGERGAKADPGKWQRIAAAKDRGPGDMFRDDILKPILSNPFWSLSQETPNSLGIICFAILTGLACMACASHAVTVVAFFQGLNEVMMKITLWVMNLAPLAIGCLITSMVAKQGMPALQSLAWYCATVILGIAVHVVALLTLVAVIGRMNPLTFLRGIADAWLIAFSTTSSAATLPVTLECLTDKLKVSPKVCNFALPVGATCNMDGTALYEGVAVIFMIQIYGALPDVPIELTAASTFIIFITAVLASIGAAAVPSAGLITMAIVASAVGLPLYYIPIIYSVDHLLDQFRTSTNVMGDAVGAVIVSRMEAARIGT